MENKERKDDMNCDCCGWGSQSAHHHKMAVLRWILGLIILFVTFTLGVKIGAFKEELKQDWGKNYQMMHGSYGGYGMDAYRKPMMGGYYAPNIPQEPNTTVPAGN